MKNKKIIIIDGNSCVHRAYHALPPLTDAEGRIVNAVFGFLKMLKKIIHKEKPTHLFVAFDHEKATFRHKDYSEYKSHRASTDTELIEQFPVVYQVLDLLNIKHLACEGFEADDIIATFASNARKKNLPVSIVTSDKDILQLVEEGIKVVDGMKNKTYDEEGVKEKLGIEPHYVIDYIALVGDKSDNLPGVRGIGPVTAVKLIKEYGVLDEIYDSIDSIDGKLRDKLLSDRDNAYVTRRLATLIKDLDLDINIEDCVWKGPDTEKLRKKLRDLNFTSIISDWVEKDELIGELKVRVLRSPIDIGGFARENSSGTDAVAELVCESGELIGIGISLDSRNCFYIPLGHKYLDAGKQPGVKETINILQKNIFQKPFGICAYDFKSFYKHLRAEGLNKIKASFDCITADYVLSGRAGTRTLQEIAAGCLGWVPPEMPDKPSEAEIEKTAYTVATRINSVFNIRKELKKKINEASIKELYENVELPVLKVLGEMEITGIKVDLEMLKEVEKELKQELKEVEKNVFTAAGEKFNINSPAQLSRILFHKLQLDTVRKTKTGYSTADDVLEELKDKHPLPAEIQKYRQIQKLLSTYIQPLPEAVDKETGRIHTNFNITGTSTGRLSSTEPNLQNIPVRTKKGTRVRESFIAGEGCIFLSADYSQIDLRVLAHISGDEKLIESFNEEEDIHSRTAALVFEVSGEKVTAEMRNRAKAINFGIVYGMSAWGLEKRVEGMNKGESEEFIKKYFLKYPAIEKYMKDTIDQARETKYVSTIMNRRRYLPEISSSSYIRRKSSERMAINTPIQGSSADIIKKAMIDLDREFRFNHNPVKLLLQIHDELLFEIPSGEEKKAQTIIKEKMENAVKLKVPLRVDFKKGKSWGSLEKC